ncbi:MAG: 4-(cytidine 5'-diphospho)-2-C-methyl-D-erythritol kinase [Candidatus Cloacimonetes bacterium HGW-Cloacimonetes-1]|jgi:4-diphosphocytidyl-2C-methyl-D-erythritol kinase|nr:MAG: 4-(cytidine 5'-diphospho)-2-C-methyl-D-erythritol kinase [Candidatus Cloacimonetes bacterium HGW-Cloacimonetes-1]
MLINSFAKINLFLEVVGLQSNNYHEIDTVFGSIDLCDTLRFALTKKPSIKLLSNLPEMVSESNLVYKVAKYLADLYCPKHGIEIHLEKRIPIAAGLGGGSSNAAATIQALNILWDIGLNLEEMMSIGAKYGSDIPYFFIGGTARGTGYGSTIQPLEDIVLDNILLVNPNIGISSKEAYTLYDLQKDNNERTEQMVHSSHIYYNGLESVVEQKYEDIRVINENLRFMGADVSMMSGSGSTCFGIFKNSEKMGISQEFFNTKGYWTECTKTTTREEYKRCFQS